ncbi:MAG TPA: alpha/beta fold hydrolase [Myxococcaceae bacterium]|nr:alpha/beta fold hydrolase [Myxococcaceae bacterium]
MQTSKARIEAKHEPTIRPERSSADAVCRMCRRPLYDPWGMGDSLCCECGLNDELFHPEARWTDAENSPRAPPRAAKEARKKSFERTRSSQLAIVRLGLKALAAIAPSVAEERGAQMFFTPRRAPRWRPPAIPELPATAFRFSIADDEIACWSWGRGPTVMLVHGWEGYAAQLTEFIRPLVSAGFRVVTFDMPAHGSSTGRQVSAFDMARVIRAVAQVFSPTRAVIGHSLGGTATIVALREGLQAERAVLLAPGAEPKHFARVLAALLGFSDARAEGMLKRIERRLGMSFDEASMLRFAPMMSVPVLVMHDPQDPEVPFKHGKRIAEAWPGARFEPLKEMGHRRMLRDVSTIKAVIAFIAKADGNQLRGEGKTGRPSSPSQ